MQHGIELMIPTLDNLCYIVTVLLEVHRCHAAVSRGICLSFLCYVTFEVFDH